MAPDPDETQSPALPEQRQRRRATWAALRVAVVYMLIGVGWILGSDYVLDYLKDKVNDPWHVLNQTAKGTFYIIATASLLFVLVRSYIRSIQKADQQIRIKEQEALALHQSELEKRVEQRTQELSRANAELTKQMDERRKIEQQLLGAKHSAEAANLAKSTFLANTSHEVRTPLTSILGYADLLLEPSLPVEQRERYVSIVQQNAAHLLQLIDDLLDLSRVEMGKMSVTVGEYSPEEIALQAVELLRPRATEKHLQLTLEVVPDVPETFKTDGVRLRQVLLNLVSNAIKFTATGHVLVKVVKASRRMSPASDAETIRFEVSDTGIGMQAAELHRIFEPFYQIEQGVNRRYGGSGLGLAISKQLVEQMGGTIAVASEPGKGSTFVVEVPVELSAPSIRSLAEAPTTPPEQIDGHILLAEDNANIRWLVEEYLRRAGASVSPVANGIDAVERITRSLASTGGGALPIDLVLIDIHMPDLDGPQAMRQMRQAGYSGPIVALTAHASEEPSRWQEFGCDAVAAKPIDRKTFIPLISRLMSESRKSRQTPTAVSHQPSGDT